MASQPPNKRSGVNFGALQAALLTGEGSREEKVEVNQRHLIDKILARYSSEFTVFRELLQNANDAGAQQVEIEFSNSAETETSSLPNTCDTIVVKNNGRPFSAEDWSRLKKIAEGNPDSSKVGFFGVGFYALFSVADEPFVVSGKECMGFFFKGDQLFTRRSNVEQESTDDDGKVWTSFYLKLRDQLDIPNIDDFGRFLTMSLAFTVNLVQVKVFVQGKPYVIVRKKLSPPIPVNIQSPFGQYSLVSPNKIFKIKEIEMIQAQFDIEKMIIRSSIAQTILSAFRSGANKSEPEYEHHTMFTRIISACMDVNIPSNYAKEMERTTKKLPPTQTFLRLLFSGYDEYETSLQISSKNPSFRELIPFPEQGRIFIGFPTHQTTGIPVHVAAHLIPTVERESIDFVDKTLAIWNQHVLHMCGTVARIIYEDEIQSIRHQFANKNEIPERAMKVASHLLNAFHFKTSTPNSVVSKILCQAFHGASTAPLSLPSTQGIFPAKSIRLHDDLVTQFCRKLPIFPAVLTKECSDLVKDLKMRQLLLPITLDDILTELSDSVLSENELQSLLTWLMGQMKQGTVRDQESRALFSRTIYQRGSEPQALANVTNVANIRMIPPDKPLPPDTLSINVSKNFERYDLEHFFGWEELSMSRWAYFIASLAEFESSTDFAQSILEVLSRAFFQLSNQEKATISSLLSTKKCIPTNISPPMYLPPQTYFKNVTLFPDLPIIQFTSRGVSDNFLKELGVRGHVDLQTVFYRLNDLNWDHVQLVKYLASVQDKLSDDEWRRLKATALLAIETEPPRDEGDDDKPLSKTAISKPRFKVSDVFAPTETFREMGLRLVEWPKGKWRNSSSEAKFLFLLGLNATIPMHIMLGLLASTDKNTKLKAFMYFCDNYMALYVQEYRSASRSLEFIPCVGTDRCYRPQDCFADPGCMIMGFPAADPEWAQHADKLGIRQHPRSNLLVHYLQKTPPKMEEAVSIFTYLSSRVSDFSSEEWRVLHVTPFIPVLKSNDDPKSVIYIEPMRVYFQTQDSSYYGDLFDFVDFGSGNIFLKSCGVKDQPSPVELAREIITDPQRFFVSCGYDRYLSVLRQIALQLDMIKQTSSRFFKDMKKSKFLVGLKRNQNDISPELSPTEEKPSDRKKEFEYELACASDIVLIDDSVLQQIFNPLSAPMESILEEMYAALGSQWLSQQVEELWTPRGDPTFSKPSMELENLIRERAPLLLYDFQNNGQQRVNDDSLAILNSIQVVEVRKIELNRKFRGQINTQPTTACCMVERARFGKTRCLLYIAGDYDMFDVATVLGRSLFQKAKLNDTLLLSTLLSTSITNLKRKGFPVDRLLNRRPEVVVKPTVQPSEPTPPQVDQTSHNAQPEVSAIDLEALKNIFADADMEFLKQALIQHGGDMNAVVEKLLENGYPRESQAEPQKEQLKIESKPREPESGPLEKPTPSSSTTDMDRSSSADNLLKQFSKTFSNLWSSPKKPESEGLLQGSVPGTFPDDKANKVVSADDTDEGPKDPASARRMDAMLKDSLKSSVQSCRQSAASAFGNDLISAPRQIQYISDNSQCEVVPAQQLKFMGHVNEVEFFVGFDTSDAQFSEIMQGCQESGKNRWSASNGSLIGRFHFLLTLMVQIFQLPQRSIHIYFDDKQGGKTIAFNRSRALFFNLHYFRILHYVPDTNETSFEMIRQTGFYFWFMTFCHELAHNFVGPHNAQHEFYFKGFAEQYLPIFIQVLRQRGVLE